jgi:tetratricopeptide (TPR) repeat protein
MPGREDVFQKALNDGHSAAWDQMWDKAASYYQKALDEFPDNPKALNSLALAQFQLQRYEEALESYRHVIKVSPDDAVAMEKIAQISEKMGNINQAAQAALLAAELFLKIRDADKAIENWSRVTQLNPENITAHSRLAMVYEKMGQTRQSVSEYIAVASLLQHGGQPQKALELIERAMKLSPDSAEAKQAYGLLRSGQMLPKPVRPRGGTGPLRMAQVKQLETPKKSTENTLDPISDARQKALKMIAEVMFELSDDSSAEAQQRRGLQTLMRGTGMLNQNQQSRIMLHLSQAIDSQTKNQDAQAAEELEHALDAGFNLPAVYFDLGYLRSRTDRTESALKYLQLCYRHDEYGLAARLISGQLQHKEGKLKEAAVEYLEALKIADSAVVAPDQADSIRQLYEPLVEAQENAEDDQNVGKLCENIQELLMRPNWREHLGLARLQLPKSSEGAAMPLAEVLIQSQSSQVLEAMNTINTLARANRLRSAMDEAFYAVINAPTYLPLHSLIGDLLIREERIPDAIAKFTVVAQAYSVRGEAAQATNILRRILKLAPMDLAVRTRLIDQLIARGQVDEAISEYIELADIYYRLAELDMARKTYSTALRVAQQSSGNRTWSTQILTRMADIDMQRLDWRQAIRVYEQIRTLRPDDETARKNLIDLNLRLSQPQQATAELDSYMTYLEEAGKREDGILFCETLIEDHGGQIFIRRALADLYRKSGRIPEAIAQLDAIGDTLMASGDTQAVVEVVNQILMMNPPNAEQYREVLRQLQS